MRVWVTNGAWLSAYRFIWPFSEVAARGEVCPRPVRFGVRSYTMTCPALARTVICRVEGSRTYQILLPSH